jgi:hypothetical protein
MIKKLVQKDKNQKNGEVGEILGRPQKTEKNAG